MMDTIPTGNLSIFSAALGMGKPFRSLLMQLFNLAWESRVKLPVLIMVGFMVFDINMQLEINVNIEVRQAEPRPHEPESDSEEDISEDIDSDMNSIENNEDSDEELLRVPILD